MTSPQFGFAPLKRGILLSDGADFILNLVMRDGAEWPEGTELFIELGAYPSDQRWFAEVDGSAASWKIESDVTDNVPDGTSFRLYVRYPDPILRPSGVETTDLLWCVGKVKRTRR